MSTQLSAEAQIREKDTILPGAALYSCIKQQAAYWAIGNMAMISLTFRDTYLQTDFYARGAADTAYLTFGILFAFCGLLSYVAHQCSESASRRSVYAGMGTVFLFIGITMGILLPNRLTITFKDFNGRPVDFANHFDQLMTTPILIHIIGEITNQRALAGACASWNHPVYIFGFLSSITDQGLSAFLAWCAVGTYSVMLHYMEAMFANSTKSNQGANMNEYALYFAKICAYGGGHLVALAWGMNRFEVVDFATFEWLSAFGQSVSKLFFLMALLVGLHESKRNLE